MNFRDFLEYKLFEVSGYSLSVYTLLLVMTVYAGTRLFLNGFNRFFSNFASRRNIDTGRQHSFHLLFRYFTWIVVVFVIMGLIGLKPTLLLASSAALLVGVGLGLQNTFADVLSGIILLFEGTVEKGDIIEVDGVVGRIEEIYLRTTQFRTRDDQVVIIPNHKFVEDKVVNWSHDNFVSRFGISIPVSYDADILQVEKILVECALNNPDVIKGVDSQRPRTRFDQFQDSSIEFTLLFYSTNLFRIETTKSDLRFAIWKKFQEHRIQIPYPQRDLHLKTGNWTLNPA